MLRPLCDWTAIAGHTEIEEFLKEFAIRNYGFTLTRGLESD